MLNPQANIFYSTELAYHTPIVLAEPFEKVEDPSAFSIFGPIGLESLYVVRASNPGLTACACCFTGADFCGDGSPQTVQRIQRKVNEN